MYGTVYCMYNKGMNIRTDKQHVWHSCGMERQGQVMAGLNRNLGRKSIRFGMDSGNVTKEKGGKIYCSKCQEAVAS